MAYCGVNRNKDGKITSVEVQNLGTINTENIVQNFLDTAEDSELKTKVQANKDLYDQAVDNYLNEKTSMNKIMQSLGMDIKAKTEFYRIMGEIGVPIKLAINQETYEKIRREIADGMPTKKIIEANKISSPVLMVISRDYNVEIAGRKEIRESVKIKDLPAEVVENILSDRRNNMPLDILYAKYNYTVSTIDKLLKANDLYKIDRARPEGQVERNFYRGNNNAKPYQSTKLDQWLRADSDYEIARFIELDEDPDVVTYTRDIPPVPYAYDGKEDSYYYPDIQVTYSDGRIEIEEVKPQKIVTKGAQMEQLRNEGKTEKEIQKILNASDTLYEIISKTQAKLNAGREYYEKQGIPYKILTENEINIKLADYSSLTKLSSRDKAELRKQKALGLDTNEFIPSQLYEQLRQQPFIDENQALDAYKNIYSDDLNEWKDSDLDC